jgi:hypothetical protein
MSITPSNKALQLTANPLGGLSTPEESFNYLPPPPAARRGYCYLLR